MRLLQPDSSRPILTTARAVEGRYLDLLLGAESPTGESPMAHWLEEIAQVQLGQDAGTAGLVAELRSAFKPMISFRQQAVRHRLRSDLRNFPWTADCASSYSTLIGDFEIETRESEWKAMLLKCRDTGNHPNPWVPLIFVLSAADKLSDRDFSDEMPLPLPELMVQLKASTAPLFVKYNVPPPETSDPDDVIQSVGELVSRMMSGAADLRRMMERNESVSALFMQGGADVTSRQMLQQPVSAQLVEPLQREINELVTQTLQLPMVKVCNLLGNPGIDAPAFADIARARFSKVIGPSIEQGLRILSRGKSLQTVTYQNVHVFFNPGGSTLNRRSADAWEIVLGSEIAVLCERGYEFAIGFREVVRKVQTEIKPGMTRAQALESLNLVHPGAPLDLLHKVLAIERTNQEMLEALDFLLGHEMAHLLLDNMAPSQVMKQSDRELQADMLAAAVVDAAHPEAMIAHARNAASSKLSFISTDLQSNSQQSMVERSITATLPGAQTLLVLVTIAGYKEQTVDSHPPIEIRYHRLNEALYNMNYWSTE